MFLSKLKTTVDNGKVTDLLSGNCESLLVSYWIDVTTAEWYAKARWLNREEFEQNCTFSMLGTGNTNEYQNKRVVPPHPRELNQKCPVSKPLSFQFFSPVLHQWYSRLKRSLCWKLIFFSRIIFKIKRKTYLIILNISHTFNTDMKPVLNISSFIYVFKEKTHERESDKISLLVFIFSVSPLLTWFLWLTWLQDRSSNFPRTQPGTRCSNQQI